MQLLFGVIYARRDTPTSCSGGRGPKHNLSDKTLIYPQCFSNNLFGFGAGLRAMVAMCVWVLFWYRLLSATSEVT